MLSSTACRAASLVRMKKKPRAAGRRSYTHSSAQTASAPQKTSSLASKRILVIGGSGMIGKGVIKEALADPQIEEVISLGRSPLGLSHKKLREIFHSDFLHLDPLVPELKNVDACFAALGANPAVNKERFEKITKLYSLSTAHCIAAANPQATFVLVSGAHSNVNSKHWALRIKGETEDAVLALPISSYVLRPEVVRPTHGDKSKTPLYRLAQTMLAPILPILSNMLPSHFTTTENLGLVFLELIKNGHPKRILETADINALATSIKQTQKKL